MERKSTKWSKSFDSRHHGRGRKVQYLVKWKGYPDSDNQWVNWDDMHTDEALEAFKKRHPTAITHIRAVLQDAFLSSTTSMSTNASAVPSPILEGDAPLPFAHTNIPTPTQPPSGPTYTPAEMYHTWKNVFIHTPSKWRMPSPSNVSLIATSSTDSLAPKEATTVSLRGLGNTPYPTIISLDSAPEQSSVASPTPTHFTISTPSPFRDIEHGSVLRPLPTTSPAPLPIPSRVHGEDLGRVHSNVRDENDPPLIIIPSAYPQGEETDMLSVIARSQTRSKTPGTPATAISDRWNVDPPASWDDTRGEPSGVSPNTPEGFYPNIGPHYVPFHIQAADGHLYAAEYTRVDWSRNPHVSGMRANSPTIYSTPLYAQQARDVTQVVPRYTKGEVVFFENDCPLCPEVDEAVESEGDPSLKADIMRLRFNEEDLREAAAKVQEWEDKLATLMMDHLDILRRLQYANAYERIQRANDGKVLKLTQEMARYEMVRCVLERGRST